MDNKKIYILDTNVLIDDPEAIMAFKDNEVAISDITLEELDKLKKAPGDTGYNARKAIRNIGSLQGNFSLGIVLPNGGMFKIYNYTETDNSFYDMSKNDNKILSIVKRTKLAAKDENKTVILVSNDIAMQIKAKVMFIDVEEYRNNKVQDTNYKGRKTILLPDDQGNLIISYYKKNQDHYCIPIDGLNTLCQTRYEFEPNEYVTLECGNAKVLTRVNENNELTMVSETYPCSVIPKNIGQKCALDALMAPADKIPLVILKGPAGCAKTFLSLAAGLDGVFDGTYNKVLISRNNVLSDNEIGYLKGDLDEKMSPLLAPFYDNLEVILRGKNGKEEDMDEIQTQIEDLKYSGQIEIASMAYMRGRSLSNTFIIIDEVQNASPNQILTLITRVSQGSKIVLCGDPDQIDAPYLNKENNGLIFASERMKGCKLCAQISFDNEESVRSELAYEAAKRMSN